MKKSTCALLAILLTAASIPAVGQDPNGDAADPPVEDEQSGNTTVDDELAETEAVAEEGPGPIRLGFQEDDIGTLGGAVQLLDEDDLEDRNLDDPEAIVQELPGTQVRTEDGYGLRPNIGVRGASSERSRKLTLMEDGVLFGPAPYAAPAAYYFPLMTRMVGLELSKGPSTVLYGPNTIGGALNFQSRSVPDALSGAIDLGLGSHLYRRAHAWIGSSNDWGGFLLEGVMIGADGFKTIDFHQDRSTGFNRGEGLLTLQTTPIRSATVDHTFLVRGGLAIERSNETYLGLADRDFDEDPNRRYLASLRDRMEWERWELRLRHRADFGSNATLETTLYHHDFQRSWRKANGFAGADFADVLANPDSGDRQIFYDVLTGATDTANQAETLRIGTNARAYVSRGLQSGLEWRHVGPRADHGLSVGARLHQDWIERDHTEDGWLIEDRSLVSDGIEIDQTSDNRGEATAFSAHGAYEVTVGALTVNPGVRVEHVRTSFDDRLADTSQSANRTAVLPGLGTHVQVSPLWGVLAGVHRGFSSVAPGQPDSVEPEYSVAYEAGVRHGAVGDERYVEAIGFFNDYSNMTSECSFSSGCDDSRVGAQFNAGEVHVAGLELLGRESIWLPNGWELPLTASYTFTTSSFQSAFESEDPQIGEVEVGDELPYVPVHQGSVGLGLEGIAWRVGVTGTFVGESREEAGSGDGPMTDRTALVDVVAAATPWRTLELSVSAENVTNARSIASRRPFGARPIRPFRLVGGLRYEF